MLTLTDLFCGAGGSSSGAEQVPGVQVRMAANHWRLAVETHNTNLPHADHDVANISQVDPRRYPVTDLLWASPECTNHSQARGRRRTDLQPDIFGNELPDEAAERSRATMWDVPRFIEAMQLRGHPYKGFVVENVVDVRFWMYFEPWTMALRAAGYCVHFVYLNSMHAQASGLPAPQSRDRFYAVGHLEAIRCPDLKKWTNPRAMCGACDKIVTAVQAWKRNDRTPWGRYRQQYVWRCPTCAGVLEPAVLPAAAAIDWSSLGDRIGDRTRPLAEKTLRRIRAGLAKYGQPVHLEAAGNTYERPGSEYVRAWPIDEPFKTLHTSASKGFANEPLRTQTARNETAVVTWPFLVPYSRGAQPHGTSEPFHTLTTRDRYGIVAPLIAELRGGGSTARPVTDPLATVTAAGNHHALVVPPGFVMRNNGSKGDGGEHCTPLTEPVRTVTTKGHQSLVTWDPAQIDVDDCLFRMLTPNEIKRAMAFDTSYVLLGNKREQVRLAGNAVTPPAARDLIGALAEAINGEAA